jgi:hypothetical protein
MDEYLQIKKLCCKSQTDDWKSTNVIDKPFIMNHYKKLMELLNDMYDEDEFVRVEYQNMFQKMVEVAELDGGYDLGMDDFQVRRVVNDVKWWNHRTESSDFLAVMGPGPIVSVDNDVYVDVNILYIGENVTEISEGACQYLGNLEYVFFHPNSKCKSLGKKAFNDCYKLKKIYLPSSLETIGTSSFEDCPSIETIIIPANVTRIKNSAFKSCTSIEILRIPDNVKTIDNDAFANCSSLVEVVIGGKVVEINDRAFLNCPGIDTVHIPDSVKIIGNEVFDCGDDYGGLMKLTGLKNIEFLGSQVFITHTELSGSVTLPKSLEYIGTRCFFDTNIDTLTLVYNDELVIEEGAFDAMANLSIVNLIGGNPSKWREKLIDNDFDDCDLLLEKAEEYGIDNVRDYVVDARRLEQEVVISTIGGPLTDKYLRYDIRGYSP